MTKEYKAVTVVQGKAVLAKTAYVAKETDEIICMYLDAHGESGRACPTMTRSFPVPTIWYEETEEDECYTEVEFPELVGWRIFSVGGGKSCPIVLTKGELFNTD